MMSYDKLVKWYKEHIEEGVPPEELEEMLKESGYSDKVIRDIQEKTSKVESHESVGWKKDVDLPPPPLGTIEAEEEAMKSKALEKTDLDREEVKKIEKEAKKKRDKKEEKKIKKKKVRTKTKIRKKHKKLLRFVLFIIIMAILGILVGGVIFLMTDQPVDEKDNTPPEVRVIVNQGEWTEKADIDIDCADKTGCEQETYRFFLTDKKECPQDYGLYSKEIDPSNKKFLCASAKDSESNVGFSGPVEINFDVTPPKTEVIEEKEWFNGDFQVKIKDHENQSGLKECFYSIWANKNILNWTSRECGKAITVRVGANGCQDKCIVKAYAIDNSENKGQEDQGSFRVDTEEPTAEITGLNTTNNTVKGIIEIVGKASDKNFENYTLERIRNGSLIFASSKDQVINGQLAVLDTRSLADDNYTLLLTVYDKAGKKSQSETIITVKNNNATCTNGETQNCSWLPGVCSASIKQCYNGFWSECKFPTTNNYEQVEISCDDGLDNDCDWLTDEEDDDCETCQDNCSEGETRCNGDYNETCGECDDDSCLDWCDPVSCNDCSCTCGGYGVTNESDTPGGCGDKRDNDCDLLIDSADPDCWGCTNQCEIGDPRYCNKSKEYYCSDCNDDPCTEWCFAFDCSQPDNGNCPCTCGNYTEGNEDEQQGWCEDGLDNDCDGLVDCIGPDPDCGCCEDTCGPEGAEQCNDTEGTLYTCTDCNTDGCLGWCNPLDCSQPGDGSCACECGNYTQGYENETLQWCFDGLDNDCDGLTDEEDEDCSETKKWNCSGDRLVGDISGDGLIDILDATILGRISVGRDIVEGDDCCADVNGDGVITSIDATQVQSYGIGNRDCFAAGYSCSMKENCSDGIDNDCDGNQDCLDSDCDCIEESICLDESGLYSLRYHTSWANYSLEYEPPTLEYASVYIGYMYNDQFRRAIKWDLSSIPDNSIITNAYFYYQTMNTGGENNGIIRSIENDPEDYYKAGACTQADIEAFFRDISNGSVYNNTGFPTFGTDGMYQVSYLEPSASIDIQNKLEENWFSMGFYTNQGVERFSIRYGDAPDPSLCFNYTHP